MNKETEKKLAELKKEREKRQRKTEEIEREILAIEEAEEKEQREFRDILPAQIQTEREGFNNQPTTEEIGQRIAEWETVVERKVEFVDTNRKYWENNSDTIVVRVERKEWNEVAGKYAMEMLGKMIDADEINAEAKGNYVIARYWWD